MAIELLDIGDDVCEICGEERWAEASPCAGCGRQVCAGCSEMKMTGRGRILPICLECLEVEDADES